MENVLYVKTDMCALMFFMLLLLYTLIDNTF